MTVILLIAIINSKDVAENYWRKIVAVFPVCYTCILWRGSLCYYYQATLKSSPRINYLFRSEFVFTEGTAGKTRNWGIHRGG